MKKHGINVLLDDFGRLGVVCRDFQIDSIKIDRSFINDMDRDGGSIEIVKTILALCRNLGLVRGKGRNRKPIQTFKRAEVRKR
ncbi:MAG: EAL domain-containing protein [Desulfotignum sp.]|nr:EAL domain-containing protein [Desulfotignum sp.]